jgi:hypothetical protein
MHLAFVLFLLSLCWLPDCYSQLLYHFLERLDAQTDNAIIAFLAFFDFESNTSNREISRGLGRDFSYSFEITELCTLDIAE